MAITAAGIKESVSGFVDKASGAVTGAAKGAYDKMSEGGKHLVDDYNKYIESLPDDSKVKNLSDFATEQGAKGVTYAEGAVKDATGFFKENAPKVGNFISGAVEEGEGVVSDNKLGFGAAILGIVAAMAMGADLLMALVVGLLLFAVGSAMDPNGFVHNLISGGHDKDKDTNVKEPTVELGLDKSKAKDRGDGTKDMGEVDLKYTTTVKLEDGTEKTVTIEEIGQLTPPATAGGKATIDVNKVLLDGKEVKTDAKAGEDKFDIKDVPLDKDGNIDGDFKKTLGISKNSQEAITVVMPTINAQAKAEKEAGAHK